MMFNIYIYGIIESSSENSALSISERVKSARGDKINIRLSSPGGDIYEAFAISNILKSYPGGYVVTVDSIAASAASVIVSEADEVFISPRSEIMIHNPWSSFSGDANSMIKQADNLNRMAENMANSYYEKTGYRDVNYWLGLMEQETWFSAEEALEVGLVDDYIKDKSEKDPDAVIASYALSEFHYKYQGRSEAPTPNTAIIMEEKNNMDNNFLIEIASKLGITEENIDKNIILAALDETLEEQVNNIDKNTSSNTEEENNNSSNTEEENNNSNIENNDDNSEVLDNNDDNSDKTEDNDNSNLEENNNDNSNTEEDDNTDSNLEENNNDNSNTEEDNNTDSNIETVQIDKDILEELKRRAALADEIDKEKKRDEAEKIVHQAIQDGKILPNKKEYLIKATLEDFDGMKKHFDSLTPGVIPINEIGRGKLSKDDTSESRKIMNNNLSKFFGIPNV